MSEGKPSRKGPAIPAPPSPRKGGARAISRGEWHARLMSGIVVNITTGCWEWTGKKNHKGYGWTASKPTHRLSYELFVGPIPKGMQIDHLCRVRHCANPSHLEVVTPEVNFRRGHWGTRTHCVHGHELSGDNVRLRVRTFPNGRTKRERICQECHREGMRRLKARRRAA